MKLDGEMPPLEMWDEIYREYDDAERTTVELLQLFDKDQTGRSAIFLSAKAWVDFIADCNSAMDRVTINGNLMEVKQGFVAKLDGVPVFTDAFAHPGYKRISGIQIV